MWRLALERNWVVRSEWNQTVKLEWETQRVCWCPWLLVGGQWKKEEEEEEDMGGWQWREGEEWVDSGQNFFVS